MRPTLPISFSQKLVNKKAGTIEYYRVNYIYDGWKTLKKLAGVKDLQLKDFRTYFNHILKTRYNFTSKEAGIYIGNNAVVNDLHYSPYHLPTIREKMQGLKRGEGKSVKLAIATNPLPTT